LKRYTRYQGAIIQNNHILLINHCEHKTGRSYWIFPGGGIESGETEGECVQREMKEETNFNVRILALLFYEPIHWKLGYPVEATSPPYFRTGLLYFSTCF